MTPEQYAELLEFIKSNHGFYEYPKLTDEQCTTYKFIKYVDASSDLRDGMIYLVTMRDGNCNEIVFKDREDGKLCERIVCWLQNGEKYLDTVKHKYSL